MNFNLYDLSFRGVPSRATRGANARGICIFRRKIRVYPRKSLAENLT